MKENGQTDQFFLLLYDESFNFSGIMSLTTSLDGFSSSVTEIKILERPLTQSVTLSLSPLLEGEEKDHTEEEGITKPLPRSQMSPVPVSNVPPWSTPMVNMDIGGDGYGGHGHGGHGNGGHGHSRHF